MAEEEIKSELRQTTFYENNRGSNKECFVKKWCFFKEEYFVEINFKLKINYL